MNICECCGETFYQDDSSDKELCHVCDARFSKPFVRKVKPENTELAEQLKENRKIAKAFGGKILTGTKKMKEWGEKIRSDKLKEMNEESAKAICLSGALNESKLWIDNRKLSAKEVEAKFLAMIRE